VVGAFDGGGDEAIEELLLWRCERRSGLQSVANDSQRENQWQDKEARTRQA
jgi:hypothetical protein